MVVSLLLLRSLCVFDLFAGKGCRDKPGGICEGQVGMVTEALSTEMQEEEAKTSVMKTRGIGKDETQEGLREAWKVHE